MVEGCGFREEGVGNGAQHNDMPQFIRAEKGPYLGYPDTAST